MLSPALMLSIKGGTGYCFFMVLTLSLIHLRCQGNRREAARLWRAHRWFLMSLLGLPCLVLFQILVTRTGKFPDLDPLLRLALSIPCFFFLASLPSRQLRLVQWGFVAGALATGAWAIYATFHPEVWYGPGRLGNSFTNPIPFGDTALLLAFLSITSIRRTETPVQLAEVAIKLIALIGGMYASYLSGSRGGWIALPLLLWFAIAGEHWLADRRARFVLAAVLVGCAIAATSTHGVRTRLAAISADLQEMSEGNSKTSTGARLDLWRASVRLYSAHPVLGVGRGSLEHALGTLAARGEVPRFVVNGRAHSEFFSVLAEMGSLGVAALLTLYGATFATFWRARRSADPETVAAAYLGLSLVGSTILYGLTIDVLTLVMNAAFFGLTSVTLLAWIEARGKELVAAGR